MIKVTFLIGSVLFLVVFIHHGQCRPELIGGLGREKPVTADIEEMVVHLNIEIKAEIMSRREANGVNIVGNAVPLTYRTQIVNGVNYFVKVGIQLGKKFAYYNVKIYKNFASSSNDQIDKLVAVRPMRSTEAISYFE